MSLRLLLVCLIWAGGFSLGSPNSSSEESDEVRVRAPIWEALRFAESYNGSFSPMPTRCRTTSADIRPISAWKQHLEYTSLDQDVVAANKISRLLGGVESKEKLLRDKTRTLHDIIFCAEGSF